MKFQGPRINTTPGPGGAPPRHDHHVDHICHRLTEAAGQREAMPHEPELRTGYVTATCHLQMTNLANFDSSVIE